MYGCDRFFADDEADSQTEGEELEKARAIRMQEAKVKPVQYLPTDTETEVRYHFFLNAQLFHNFQFINLNIRDRNIIYFSIFHSKIYIQINLFILAVVMVFIDQFFFFFHFSSHISFVPFTNQIRLCQHN